MEPGGGAVLRGAPGPEGGEGVGDEGLGRDAVQRFPEAAARLRQYLDMTPEAADAAQVQQLLRTLSTHMRQAGGSDAPDELE